MAARFADLPPADSRRFGDLVKQVGITIQ